jgi:hypothetical protein
LFFMLRRTFDPRYMFCFVVLIVFDFLECFHKFFS